MSSEYNADQRALVMVMVGTKWKHVIDAKNK